MSDAGPPGNVLAVCWRQWRAERALARRGVRFRSTDPAAVAAGYAAMSAAEFEAVNGRQDWANRRTIPRALDLGCGTGTSTRVLAACSPPGSEIVGYELAAPLLDHARRRRYAHRGGEPAGVAFVCQGVTEPFRDAAGALIGDRTVDLVNASGVVGHHLNAETVRPLIDEARRVLVPGGLAVLDDGPTLPAAALVGRMRAAGFEPLGRYKSWPLAPCGQTAFRLTP